MFDSRVIRWVAAGGLVVALVIVALIVLAGCGRDVVKRFDSRNASEGTNCTEGGGSLTRGGLGDVFAIPRQPRVRTSRCTWLDNHFSRMGRYEIYDVKMRFDKYAQSDGEHAAVALLRPVGRDLEGGVCGSTGNKGNMIVRVYVDRETTPDHWKVDVRGGESPWPRDQDKNLATVDLGEVIEGDSITLEFDLFLDYVHGSATVWKDGEQVYEDRDRPLGFHYNCAYRSSNLDDTPDPSARDVSQASLHMQHGIYRNATPAWTLTSTGFRFYCSQRTPCP